MRMLKFVRVLLIAGLFGVNLVNAGTITFTVESPGEGSSQTGVSTIRGWAVSTAGIDHVELAINGVFSSNLPYGSLRNDIGNAFPGIEDSELSGFSSIYNYAKLDAGANKFLITAFDNDGASKSILINFTVVKFQKAFFQDETPLGTDSAFFLRQGDNFAVTNVDMEGEPFSLVVGWDKKSQNLSVKAAAPASYSPMLHDAEWFGQAVSDQLRAEDLSVCGNMDMRPVLLNGIVSGFALTTMGDLYTLEGGVGSDGELGGTFRLDGAVAGSFGGIVTSNVMAGAWVEVTGCNGRWYAIQE